MKKLFIVKVVLEYFLQYFKTNATEPYNSYDLMKY